MARSRKIAAVPGGSARLVDALSSPAMLPEDGTLRRGPRAPGRRRPAEFLEAFESRLLFYDAFWHADGQRILLVGPPPLNLEWEFRTARFTALPLEYWMGTRFHISESVMITELVDPPRNTTEIVVHLGGRDYVLPIRPSFAAEFAGRNVVFTMSKDNEPGWIAEWARYHVRIQGADAVVLFDNGSTRYPPEEIEAALLSVAGLDRIAVLSWPFKYGQPDRAVLNNPFYSLFAQIGSMSVALRRFAPLAHGLLNADIDELVATPRGTTIFDLLDRTWRGLIVMRGQYMEAIPDEAAPAEGRTHRDYPFVLSDPKARQSRQKKWALQPTRPWVAALKVHPYMHWIRGRPVLAKSLPPGVFYRHFKGISTGWKDGRAIPPNLPPGAIERDATFVDLMEEV
jgi:hypothetical protein